MGRTRTDYRDTILEKLELHGPLRFSQLRMYLQVVEPSALDYDLRCLRRDGKIHTIAGGLWSLIP